MSLDELIIDMPSAGQSSGRMVSDIIDDFEVRGFHLSPTEVSVLAVLARGYEANVPLLMSKKEILRNVGWPDDKNAKYDPVQRYTSKLRSSFKQAGLQCKYWLHTVDLGKNGTGYMLLADTPGGRKRIVSLLKMPLHEAPNMLALHQAIVLCKLELTPDDTHIMYHLFRSETSRPISEDKIAVAALGDSSKKKHVHNRLVDIRNELHGRNINGFGYEIRHAGNGKYQLRIIKFERQRWQDDLTGLAHKGVRLSPLEEKLLDVLVRVFPVPLPLEDVCHSIWGSSMPPKARPYHIVRGINAKFAASQLEGMYKVRVSHGIGFSLEAKDQKTFEEYCSLKRAPLHHLNDYRKIRAMLEMNGIHLNKLAARALVPLLERADYGAAPYETLAMAIWGDNYQRISEIERVMVQLKQAFDDRKINGFEYYIQKHPVGYSIRKLYKTSSDAFQ